MNPTDESISPGVAVLRKAPTGITGLDEITRGGFPMGRPTLVAGAAGCGKTLMAMEFLINGAMRFDEPGVFLAFEETAADLAINVASLGFNLAELEEQGKLVVDYIHTDRSMMAVVGEFDLEALFIRLQLAVESIGAKRVAIDTLEVIFGTFDNLALVREEVRRLFRWLKERELTAVITAEKGDGAMTRHGMEEYVSDCVVVLDHRILNQVSTRRIRIAKYRGSAHGTNEYPFLIDETGISVLPISSLNLDHKVSNERISTGISGLDSMLEGKGYYRGSTIMVSGTAGSGKSSLAAHLVDATCGRGESCLYFAFEESQPQILRNMSSIGLNLGRWVEQGLLTFHASRPTVHGLEMHLAKIHRLVREEKPSVIVIDPITNLTSMGTDMEINSMMVRLIDFLKSEGITAFFTSLVSGGQSSAEMTEINVSSLIDTWLLVRDIESNGERNRGLYILKSRGMAHSNQIREFLLSDEGIKLIEPYLGPHGVLTGSQRKAQEAMEKADALELDQEIEIQQLGLERKRKLVEVQIENLQAELRAEEELSQKNILFKKSKKSRLSQDRHEMAVLRHAEAPIRNGARAKG